MTLKDRRRRGIVQKTARMVPATTMQDLWTSFWMLDEEYGLMLPIHVAN